MALKFNNNTPKEIIYNGLNVAKVIYNNVVVWLQRILYTITGIPPLTANKSFGEPLVDYKIYGNSEQRNLPNEYQEVEYIENTGNSYINTGIIPDNNTDIGIIVSDINESSAQIFVAGGTFRIAKFTASRLVGATIGSTALNSSASGVDKFKAEIINKTFYLDDVEIGSSTDTINTTYSLEIFRGNYGGAQFYSKFKCYGAYIKQNGELILDLVPCYRKSDDKPGMYDLVNNVFYINAGTGDFTVGADKTTPTTDRPIEIKNVGERFSPSGLPSGYEEVEYLESTGTQYIDTGFKTNQDTRVIIKAQVPDGQTIGNGYRLFGARDSTTQNAFFLSTSNDSIYSNYNNASVSTDALDYNMHIFDINKNIFYLDGNIVKQFTYSEFSTNYNALLFGGNSNGTIVSKAWKIYECKLYDNGILIRNFIPCYRISDNKPGMYDTVNNVFYINVGTGEFTVGSSAMKYKIPVKVNNVATNVYLDEPLRKIGKLPIGYQEVEYVVFDGNSRIELNYYPNQNTKAECKFLSTTSNSKGIYASTSDSSRSDNFSSYFSSFGGNQRFGNTTITTAFSDNVDYIIVQDKNGFVKNGTLSPYSSVPDFTSANHLKIGYAGSGFVGRFYYFKVWENDVLIIDAIPCYRRSDNEIGFYDVINNVFYTNAGTGEFTAGNTISGTDYIDYIDYGEQKRITNVEVIDDTGELPIEQSYRGLANPIEETIILPDILTNAGANTIDVDTEVQPSNMEIQYEGTKF